MNLYKLTVADETDYVVADTAIRALRHYYDMTGTDLIDFEGHDDIELIHESEYESIIFHGEEGESRTASEIMKETHESSIIGSTAYYRGYDDDLDL